MTDWFTTHEGILDQVWVTLAEGVSDPAHPARQPTFATVSPDGWPEARTVVLRSADPALATITVHTDLFSDKIKSLTKAPRAALHIWHTGQALQIRMQGEVQIASGPETLSLWDGIPDHAQQSYGVTPPPGTPIKHALDYIKQPDPKSFAVLTCHIGHIDVVHLGEVHRRASFSRGRAWQGEWLSP